MAAKQNPDWTRDELILAFALYLREGLLDDTDPKIIQLSEVLNRLPIHASDTRTATFRNPNGVARKLTNLANHDPDYHGRPTKGSALDGQVYAEWFGRRLELERTAATIIERLDAGTLPSFPEPDEEEVEADEGRLLYRAHRTRERDPKLRKKKIEQATANGGPLCCIVCGFNFEAAYGERGAGFMECHHVVPLHETGATRTRLDDLALVCSNCHRMIHRRRPWPTPAELAQTLRGT